MEEKNNQLQSIFGKWWEPVRKWFYPAWLIYETSIRFYEYAQSVHNKFIIQQDYIASFIGKMGVHILDIFCCLATFSICTFFLTVPTCFVLYKFFKIENLTNTQFEERIKIYL